MAFSNLRLQSPGIQFSEIDNSLFSTPRVGTVAYYVGFSKSGPTNEPVLINSVSEFEQLFGVPETPAEQYLYHGVKEALATSDMTVYVTRLAYGPKCGSDQSDLYSALVYPVIAVSATEITPCAYYTSLSTSALVSAAAQTFPELLNYISADDYVESYSPRCDFKFSVTQPANLSALEISHKKTCSGYFDSILFKNQQFSLATLTGAGARFWTNVNSVPASATTITNNEFGTTVHFTSPLSTNGVANYVRLSAANFAAINLSSVDININNTLSYDLTSNLQTSLYADTNFAVPVEMHFKPVSGCFFDCGLVTDLNLKVPESARWKFSTLNGASQLNDGNFYVFGEPIHRVMSEQEYDLFKNNQFDWKCGAVANVEGNFDIQGNDVRAGMVIVNKLKTTVDDDFTGFYIAVNDNYNVNPSTDFNNVTAIAGKYSASECVGVTGTWTGVDQTRLDFDVSQPFNGNANSLAEIIENSSNTDFSKPENKDSLSVVLFKLVPSLYGDSSVKLNQRLVEKFIGSLDSEKKISDSYGGAPRSGYLENAVNEGSNYLHLYVNPYLSENNCWKGSDGHPQKYVRMLRKSTKDIIAGYNAGQSLTGYADKVYALGVNTTSCVDKALAICKRKDIGYLPCKLERALKLADFADLVIDLTVDTGLSTIWATRNAVAGNPCNANGGDVELCYHYDDTVYVDTSSLMPYDNSPISSPLQDGWEEIYDVFDSFILEKVNGVGIGHFHLQDPLRQIFISGKDYKITNRQKSVQYDKDGKISDRFSTFSRNIFTPLKNLTQGVNSSYVGMWANWMKGYIPVTDKTMWLPSSNYLAPALARTDRQFWPWYGTFGVERGILPNILDIAINPSNQRERDFLYRINMNPIYLDSTYGYMVFGQKTMLKTEKDTNRIAARRGLLWLEKNLKIALVPFIGEQNTLITRNRIKNAITPFCDTMKQNFGLENFEIVADERNQDQNNLSCIKVNVLVQLTKAVEFIDAVIQVERSGVSLTQAFLF